MRRTKLYLLVALLAIPFSSAASAQSGLFDTQPVKPVMMLLVDTSGSMERMPDKPGCVDCMPSCTNSPTDTAQKNRWAVTLEALTGTFTDYRCVRRDRSYYSGKFDEHYFLPHYDFSGSPGQATDGVLDVYKNRLKFGLMTFDGVMTTVNGATLVPYGSYASVTSVKTQIDGLAGMYSYPKSADGWKPLFFPGCAETYGVNAGARAEGSEAGSLLSVGLSDSGPDVQQVNTNIQSALLGVRPYGGTPIAAMLDDLKYYLQHHNDIKSGSDPYASCRDRYAILLTDGAPDALFRGHPFNCEQGTCPYQEEKVIAESLRTSKLVKKLWVVAFNVNDQSALTKLDDIATAGAETKAFQAATPALLREQLDKLMNLAQPAATSRSVPVVVNTGKAVVLGGKQFEISAGFRISSSDEPWEGRLFRRRIGCDGAAVKTHDLDVNEGDMFHVTLNSQPDSERELKTLTPDTGAVRGSVYKLASTADAITSSKLNVILPDGNQFGPFNESDDSRNTSQEAARFEVDFTNLDKSVPQAYFGDANRNSVAGEPADRDTIVDYLRGLSSNRLSRKLGDIYHSNPVVLPPLFPNSELLSSFDPQLRGFYLNTLLKSGSEGPYDATYGRPGVIFVGTNDGILHAFNLDKWKDKQGREYKAGEEFWGFVPPALFDKLALAVRPTNQFMFDGTPVVKDVIFSRSLSAPSGSMGTVLLAAVRGAPAFVALDVTTPEKPKFLWQRSFGYVGDTLGTPAIAHIKVTWNNQPQIRAVAILPGGEGVPVNGACDVNKYSRGKAPNGRDQVRCWKLRGRSLYVVDIETGELVQEFDARHFHSPLNGAVTVDAEGLSLASAAYMADADGVLWRLSMRNTDPSKWRVMPIWDVFAGTASNFQDEVVSVPSPAYSAGRPALYPPLLAREPKTGNLTIVVGTGDVDNLIDNVPHRVVSLTEARKLSGDGELTNSGITLNWALQLDMGEAVTGPLVMLDNAVYFASFTGPAGGSGDVCNLGTSRLVGADVRNKVEGKGVPQPRLMNDAGELVLQYKPTTAANSLLLGLSIARDPVCIAGEALNDPTNTSGPGRLKQTGGSGGGNYQMRTMVAGQGGSEMAGSNSAGGGAQRQFTRTLPTPNVARSVGWASSIE